MEQQNYFFTREEGAKLEAEIDQIKLSLESLVRANIKIEFFLRGGISLYALDYFGGKDFIIGLAKILGGSVSGAEGGSVGGSVAGALGALF